MLNFIFGSNRETRRILEKYGEERGQMYIGFWRQRTLRTYITSHIPDFQAHLTEVLVDRLDDCIEKKYSMDVEMEYRDFLSEINEEKLFRETNMKEQLQETLDTIYAEADKEKTTIQQAAYTYFLNNYDI